MADYGSELQRITQSLDRTNKGGQGSIQALIRQMQATQPAPQAPQGGGSLPQLVQQAAQGTVHTGGSSNVGAYHAGVGIPGGGLTEIHNGSGARWTVAKGAAGRFQSLLDILEKQGYKAHSSGGFVDRDVRGHPGIKSEHAYGRAIDINAETNPLGSLKSDLPANISAIAKSLGLLWGGDFRNRKDPMHFEYNGS